MMRHDIDFTAWQYGGDVCCPECQDETLYFSLKPIWATDQTEAWEVMCPVCGVIAIDHETVNNEDADLYHQYLVEFERHLEQRGEHDVPRT